MQSINFDSWVGRQIGEHKRYRLEAKIGDGGMGVVFRARDVQLGRIFAVKILKGNFAEDDQYLKRFEREASICVALANQSHYVTRVEDYGVTGEGYPYFAMEYLVGKTLGEYLLAEKTLPATTSLHIFKQICLGLKAAHEGVMLWRDGQFTEPIKIIHRDLKPENIFLVSSGTAKAGEVVKILDFGVAKIYGDSRYTQLSESGFFIGTYAYTSPEQCQGDSTVVDERSDIYSLGLILYRMLSGTDPFGLSQENAFVSPAAWLWAHTATAPKSLLSQPGCNEFDPQLEAIIDHCLAKDPADRFQSVEELLKALQEAEATQFIPLPFKPNQREPNQQSIKPNPKPIISSSTEQAQGKIFSKLMLGGVGIFALLAGGYGLISGYQAHIVAEIRSLREQSQFEQCIGKAVSVPKALPNYPEIQKLLSVCRLDLGKQLALDKQYAQAIATVQPIPKDDPNFSEATSLIEKWSDVLYPNGAFGTCDAPNSLFCPDSK
jgi:serine/threonine protein kinase